MLWIFSCSNFEVSGLLLPAALLLAPAALPTMPLELGWNSGLSVLIYSSFRADAMASTAAEFPAPRDTCAARFELGSHFTRRLTPALARK